MLSRCLETLKMAPDSYFPPSPKPSALAHDDRIIYQKTTGALYYDSNGDAAGGAIKFAQLTAGLTLTNSDFLVF
jgi:hypothetical protein